MAIVACAANQSVATFDSQQAPDIVVPPKLSIVTRFQRLLVGGFLDPQLKSSRNIDAACQLLLRYTASLCGYCERILKASSEASGQNDAVGFVLVSPVGTLFAGLVLGLINLHKEANDGKVASLLKGAAKHVGALLPEVDLLNSKNIARLTWADGIGAFDADWKLAASNTDISPEGIALIDLEVSMICFVSSAIVGEQHPHLLLCQLPLGFHHASATLPQVVLLFTPILPSLPSPIIACSLPPCSTRHVLGERRVNLRKLDGKPVVPERHAAAD